MRRLQAPRWVTSVAAILAGLALSAAAGAGPTAGEPPSTDATVAPAPPSTAVTIAPTTSSTTVAEPSTTTTTTTTTTTITPTTTTPPTTVVAPVIAPPPTTAPPPPAAPGPDPGPGDAAARARAAIDTYVPAAHRVGIDVRIEAIPGHTSWAYVSHLIEIGEGQADDSWEHVAFIAAHEYGHLVAFEFGSGQYHGAPPVGFPARGNAAETWADCYGTAVTGFAWTTQCAAQQLDWARAWAFGS